MTEEQMIAPSQRIRVKVSLFVLLLLVSTTLVFYVITARIMSQHILSEMIKRAEALSRSMASSAGYSLLSQDLLGLDTIVYRIKSSNQDIEYIAVVNPANEILVHSDIEKAGQKFSPAEGPVIQRSEDGTIVKDISGKFGSLFEMSSPVVFMDKDLGFVILGINKSALVAAQQDVQKETLSVFAVILILGVASSLLLSSFMTRPIQELSKGVTELKQGKRSRPLHVYSRDELGRLTESFNEMTALITAQRDKLSKSAQDLEEAYIATIRVLAAAIDARDNYTLGHSTRVAQLSLGLAQELGFNKKELEELEIACLFHDVGKIKLPDSILLKEGRLDALEHREMQRHSEYGAEILSKASSLFKYIPAVRHHHEWFDGTGYPDGLAGDKIPLAAAIISLADVYDAMTSDRPYRKALTEEDAQRKIMELAGRQFHPDLAVRFVKLLEKKAEKVLQ
jgi:putative nucleotidyltransferase with HDIG domain